MTKTDVTGDSTTAQSGELAAVSGARVPALTVVYHPDLARIGHRLRLTAVRAGRSVSIARGEPEWFAADAPRGAPLGGRFLSRTPVTFEPGPNDGVRIASAQMPVTVNGEGIAGSVLVDAHAIAGGVVITIAKRLVLLLHLLEPPALDPVPDLGWLGASDALERLRRVVLNLAGLPVTVLLRGETGTGKELCARALHDHSPRRAGPFVAVNMAAVPPTLAAAELFGHVRGAFSGADRDEPGYFGRADGGTLFLDEIGDTPPELQNSLLRALDSGEAQPVGAAARRSFDVRVIAATDADLDALCQAGRFRTPLLHRLSGYVIRVPALRERRDDVAPLLLHFLREELGRLGAAERLAPAPEPQRAWLSAAVVAQLVRSSWPGNVRQLRNVARQLAVAGRAAAHAHLDPALAGELGEPAGQAPRHDAAPLPGKTPTRDELAERQETLIVDVPL